MSLPFYTFQRWWMWWWPHSQRLNIQHAFFLYSSTSSLLNNSASSCHLCLCLVLCVSFFLTICCSFSMALSTLMMLWTLEIWKCAQLPTINTKLLLGFTLCFLSLNVSSITFIFLHARHLLINTWSLKFIRPITTSLCVYCITTWKHFMSSLWMNTINFIFQVFHIINLHLLVVLAPPCSPCTPFVDYAHSFVDYVNSFTNFDHTFVICTNFFVDCANKFDDCVKTLNDETNIVVDSVDSLTWSSSNL